MVQPWYAEFVKIDRELLFDLVAAANYMNIKPLLDLSCLAVSILIKGKSAAELRSMFNIQEEFTAEEQAQIERENESVLDTNNNHNNDNPKNNNNNNRPENVESNKEVAAEESVV
jgi:Skp1 family, dimerisation domain